LSPRPGSVSEPIRAGSGPRFWSAYTPRVSAERRRRS
jgi:hypothetical protein